MPATNAMIFLSMCHGANFITIHLILATYSIITLNFNSKTEIYSFSIMIYSALTLLDYLFLYRNRDKIYEKYKDESKKQKLIGNILLILYILGSFAIVFYLASKYSSSIAAH
jgi:archaellum biogenesis protein FlaJ (TadC family)